MINQTIKWKIMESILREDIVDFDRKIKIYGYSKEIEKIIIHLVKNLKMNNFAKKLRNWGISMENINSDHKLNKQKADACNEIVADTYVDTYLEDMYKFFGMNPTQCKLEIVKLPNIKRTK